MGLRPMKAASATNGDVLRPPEETGSREEMLAAISHDMQTPLASIVGLADLLGAGGDLPLEERREIYTTLSRQAHVLRNLVQQFLDFSRLEHRQRLVVNRTAADVVDVIDRVRQRFAHQREIHVGAPADLPHALADPERLDQVLTNLLSNALKYSGGPVVVVARGRGQDVVIEVIDDGPGFDGDQHDELFAKFHRGGNAAGIPGSGLGLYISRAICEAQGGSLTCESFPGIGSRFRVRLPAVRRGEAG